MINIVVYRAVEGVWKEILFGLIDVSPITTVLFTVFEVPLLHVFLSWSYLKINWINFKKFL